MDSLITAIDTTRATVVAIAETLRTTVTVADTARTTTMLGQGQGVPETWTILAGGALAYGAQVVRGFKKIPSLFADSLILGIGIALYVVGFEGQIQLSRGFFVGAVMWLASVRGFGAWFANAGAAPRSNTL